MKTYTMLVEELGEPLTQKLCGVLGGEKIYVPATPRDSSPLAEVLSEAEFAALCLAFGRERLDVPLGPARRRAQALAELRLGVEPKKVAKKFGYTLGSIRRLRNE